MSAPVTDWPLRIVLVLLVIGAIGGLLGLMLLGWRRRAGRQADVAAPPAVPDDPGASLLGQPAEGLYLGTVTSGDWLDRIVVHGLGVRSRALVDVTPDGISVLREGAPDLWLPMADVSAVRSDRGIAGRAYERDGVVIMTWRLGDRLVDTGFRAQRAADHAEVLAVVAEALDEDRPEGPEGSGS